MDARADGDAVPVGDTLNLEDLERGAITRALQSARGVRREAAGILGVSPRVLNYKIQNLKLDWKAYRKA